MDRELTPQELAYAAGVLDGEGCIKINPRGQGSRGRVLRVEIVNTNRKLIDWMHERFGGSIQVRVPKNPKHKTLYVHNLACRDAAALLKLVRPYLIIKAVEADVEIILQGLKVGYRDDFTNEQEEVEEFLASTMADAKKGGK